VVTVEIVRVVYHPTSYSYKRFQANYINLKYYENTGGAEERELLSVPN